MQSNMMNFPLLPRHLLGHAAKLYGTVEIVSRLPDKSLHRETYRDLEARNRALAKALISAGLRPGDRVATLMWNHYAHLEAYFGIPASGGILHTLNLRLHPDDIAYISNHAEDRFLIVDDTLLDLYAAIRPHTHFERVFVVSLAGHPLPPGCESYEALLAEGAGKFTYPDLAETTAAAMCYTSGTTGRPKGVLYSHRSIVLHSLVSALPNALNLGQRDVLVPVVPMFHAISWGLPYTATLAGCKQVMPGPHLDPESLLDLYQQERVSVSAGVPTIWLGILERLEREPERWQLKPGMRMVVGGSAAPEGMIRGFDKFGLEVLHAWGMTETSPLGTVSQLKSYLSNLPADEAYALRAKQGLPVPLFEARAMGDSGEAPQDGKTLGELEVRGPWVAASYYRGERPESWSEDGWFRTGDVVTIDPEGYVKITDRTKDLIKSGGEWISSVDLENALMSHPAVAEAAVIALPDPKWQERPAAVVVLKRNHSASEDELREYLRPKFAKWWLPDVIYFATEIPRTSTGKFLKSRLRKIYAEQEKSRLNCPGTTP